LFKNTLFLSLQFYYKKLFFKKYNEEKNYCCWSRDSRTLCSSLLIEKGYEVTLLEASNRTGDRIWTNTDKMPYKLYP